MTIPPPDASTVAGLAWLSGTAVGMAAVAAIWHYTRRAIRGVLRTAQYVDVLHTLGVQELSSNGGTSMKDKLDRQGTAIQRLTPVTPLLQQQIAHDDVVHAELLASQAAQRADQAAQRADIDALRGMVEELLRRAPDA